MLALLERFELETGDGRELRCDLVGEAERGNAEIVELMRRGIGDPDFLTMFGFVVAGKREVGSGANRMELYPLRGASTERQYMVYFPEHHLLYASDTLALNGDGSLYDPELMYEVAQAVKRENLSVDKVYAMHEGPVDWSKVIALIEKAQHA